MKYFDWNEDKNKKLLKERGVSFEDVLAAIEENKLLGILPHPNPRRYPGQKMYILQIDNYVYVVPFKEQDENIFLITIYPSRKATKEYLT